MATAEDNDLVIIGSLFEAHIDINFGEIRNRSSA